jgi:6-phosphofructokinase 1
MAAIVGGRYAHSPLPEPSLGSRRVDIATGYNVERFRPRYDGRLGEPLLLDALT